MSDPIVTPPTPTPAPASSPAPASLTTGPVSLADQFKSILEPQGTAPATTPAPAPLAGADVAEPVTPPVTEPVVPAEDLATDPALLDEAEFENTATPIDPKSTRGQELWAHHKFYRDLAAPIEQGGIGHEPTVDDLRTYHNAHLINTKIETDLNEGSPRFLEGMASWQPEGLAQVLAQLPEFLTKGRGASAELAPIFEPVRQALSTATLQSAVDSYLDAARQAADPKVRTTYFERAKALASDFLGKNLADTDLTVQRDPFAEERERIDRERKENERFRSERSQEQYKNWQRGTESVTLPELEKAAGELLQAFKDVPAYGAARRELMRQTIDHVDQLPQAMSEFRAIHARVQTMIKAGRATPEFLKAAESALTKKVIQYARPYMSRARTEVAKNFGLLRTVQPKRPEPVPAATATPVPSSPAPAQLERQPGEDANSFIQRSFARRLQTLQ